MSTPLGSPRSLRVITPDEVEKVTYDEGLALFRAEWKQARTAYVELLSELAGYWVRVLLDQAKPLSVHEVRAVRSDGERIATKARALVSHLDAAVRAVERVDPKTQTTTPKES